MHQGWLVFDCLPYGFVGCIVRWFRSAWTYVKYPASVDDALARTLVVCAGIRLRCDDLAV
jgi:hypothetical protein